MPAKRLRREFPPQPRWAARAVALRGRFSITGANFAKKDSVAIDFSEHLDGAPEQVKNAVNRISLRALRRRR